jgi:hypothetical protein
MTNLLAPIIGALKNNLLEWEDYDVSAYKLGISLGLFQSDDGSYEQFREHKNIFYVSNPVGDFLFDCLEKLVVLGFLEEDRNMKKYRWRLGAESEVLA